MCKCQMCGMGYTIDLLIPDYLWDKISPKKDSLIKAGGLLCGACIMNALEKENQDYFISFIQAHVSFYKR